MWIHPITARTYGTHDAVRAAFHWVSFPTSISDADLESVGLRPVLSATRPAHDPITHVARELPPIQVAGVWTQQWTVQELPLDLAAANLAAAKASKNAEINAARLAANRSTFSHAGKTFACDELSRSDIDGINGFVALNSAMPPGWPGGWKAVDNSVHPIPDVGAWKAFYAAMVAAGNANFAKAQALKATLAAASTAAQIAAVVW